MDLIKLKIVNKNQNFAPYFCSQNYIERRFFTIPLANNLEILAHSDHGSD